jgi:heme O synthase-like polyprenyltransferase
MKATAPPLSQIASAEKSWVAVYADLFKARLTFLVLLTTLVGFYLGSIGTVNYLLMLHTILGTALVAAGASAPESTVGTRVRRSNAPHSRSTFAFRPVAATGCALFGMRLSRRGVWVTSDWR